MKTGFLALLFFCSVVSAQTTADTTTVLLQPNTTASAQVVVDSLTPPSPPVFSLDSLRYVNRLFFSFTNPVRYTVLEKKWGGRDAAFYTVVGLLLIFAAIKNGFGRYLVDLYSSYFRTTMRQRQIKEQLLQSPLPSLLFNVFFVLSTAVFLALLFQHLGLAPAVPFWQLAAYAAAGVAVLYGVKFLALKFFGWLFGMMEAADTYIFIVFSTNKILGVALLPFTVLMALTEGSVTNGSVLLSYVVIGGLLLYRYFLSLVSIGAAVRVQPFHFLLYAAALEVLPLVLLNKLLLTVLREMA